jgi:hypothetical protein
LLWIVIANALLPPRLLDTVDSLRRFVEHLRRPHSASRTRKADAFRRALSFG